MTIGLPCESDTSYLGNGPSNRLSQANASTHTIGIRGEIIDGPWTRHRISLASPIRSKAREKTSIVGKESLPPRSLRKTLFLNLR